jgi:hypothetical protein
MADQIVAAQVKSVTHDPEQKEPDGKVAEELGVPPGGTLAAPMSQPIAAIERVYPRHPWTPGKAASFFADVGCPGIGSSWRPLLTMD